MVGSFTSHGQLCILKYKYVFVLAANVFEVFVLEFLAVFLKEQLLELLLRCVHAAAARCPSFAS